MLCKSSLEIALKALQHYNADLSISISKTASPNLCAWYKFRQSQNDSVIGQIQKILRELQ